MVVILNQIEVIKALEDYLSKQAGVSKKITRIKFRRKSSRTDDVGSILIEM